MISIQRLTAIRDALTPLTANVYHYWRPKLDAPFILWQEIGEGAELSADNHKAEFAFSGTVDLYTKTEYDPLFDEIQEALNGVDGLGWMFSESQYEDETGLIHHSWDWKLL